MGTFRVDCQVEDHVDPARKAVVSGLLVDTGSEHTWIPGTVLKRLRVKPQKKDVAFVMANGETVTRNIGFAVLRIGGVLHNRRGGLRPGGRPLPACATDPGRNESAG